MSLIIIWLAILDSYVNSYVNEDLHDYLLEYGPIFL